MRTVDRRDLHLEIQPPDERPISPPRLPTRSRWPIWLGGAAALLALAISLGIHSRRQADERLTQVAEQAAVQVVNVTSPKPGAAAEEIALPGNTLAFNDTPIYARASGYLKKWHVDIGARVRAGDLLAEIEVPELDQQLHQAQADLETAQTNLELAKITNTRWQNLLVQRVVSSQEADQVKSDFGVKQAALLASAANVRRLEETQKYERVIAPFDGIITARGTDIGALVEPGASATGHELFHLSAVQQLRVYVAVPEVYADSVVDGSKVTLTLSSNATRSFAGTVVRNANAIDLTTRTLNVEVDVDNRDGRLLPGAYVIVHFKLSESSGSVTIPSNALLFRGEGLRVAKVVKGAVSLALVTIGHDFGSTVEVTSGLSPQDVIVLDPSDSLADGAQVEVSESGKSAVIK
jgi:RND family efflux transporter MFP subunit